MPKKTSRHLLAAWMKAHDKSDDAAAELCRKKGHALSPRYIKLVRLGHNRPSFPLCLFFAEELLKSEDVLEAARKLYRYPYTRKTKMQRDAA